MSWERSSVRTRRSSVDYRSCTYRRWRCRLSMADVLIQSVRPAVTSEFLSTPSRRSGAAIAPLGHDAVVTSPGDPMSRGCARKYPPICMPDGGACANGGITQMWPICAMAWLGRHPDRVVVLGPRRLAGQAACSLSPTSEWVRKK
jgi:hypothetical protein